MPDIPNRDELEKKLARKLSGLQRTQMMRLLEYLGDPPRLENVPPGFWDEAGKEFASVVSPFLENIFLEQAKEMMMSQPVGVDWALVNQRAVDWAHQYTFDLVRGINDTSRRTLQSTVSAYFERGQTIGELEQAIGNLYSPVRSEMIAITEVTRASVQGELAIAKELSAAGIEMIAIWQTNNDELVCPLCSPLNGKAKGDGWIEPPPAHPRCRCFLNHELPKVKK